MGYKALHSKNIIFLEYASIVPCFFEPFLAVLTKESLMEFHQALYA